MALATHGHEVGHLQAVLDREHEFRFLAVQPLPLEEGSGATPGMAAANTDQRDPLAVSRAHNSRLQRGVPRGMTGLHHAQLAPVQQEQNTAADCQRLDNSVLTDHLRALG
jgi:hypothetical protein